MRKAYAYITSGRKVLLLRHPDHPEAGVQVPGGTVKEGEDWVEAALREAREETGLEGLIPVRIVGFQEYDMARWKDEIQHRAFVHLKCPGETVTAWENFERHPEGGGKEVKLSFEWAELDGTDMGLIAGHGALLAMLKPEDLSGPEDPN